MQRDTKQRNNRFTLDQMKASRYNRQVGSGTLWDPETRARTSNIFFNSRVLNKNVIGTEKISRFRKRLLQCTW